MNFPSNLLDEALGLSADALPPLRNRVILVEDCVETSGTFVLHHLVKCSLSPGTNTSLLLIAIAQPFSHYDRIMRKMVKKLALNLAFLLSGISSNNSCALHGYNLSAQREKKRLQFVDMLNLEYPAGHKDGLMGFYSNIQNAVQTSYLRENVNVTIMINDISLLEIAARGSGDDVLDFLHYCVTQTSELGCSLVILNHEDIYESGEALRLLVNLEYIADIVIKTEPLSTGSAADVHGQLTITRKAILNELCYSANKISNFYFEVKENGAEYFCPGSRH